VVGTFGHVLRECDPSGLKDSAAELRPVVIVVVDELYRKDPVEVAAVAVDSSAELAVLGEELRPLELAWLLVSTMKNAERPF
jgi:hypothetical protein